MSIHTRVEVTLRAAIELDEQELGALDALVGYGVDPFLKVFYEKLGKAYMQPHEAGLRSLFEKIRAEVPSALRKVHDARKDHRAGYEARMARVKR